MHHIDRRATRSRRRRHRPAFQQEDGRVECHEALLSYDELVEKDGDHSRKVGRNHYWMLKLWYRVMDRRRSSARTGDKREGLTHGVPLLGAGVQE